MKLNFKKLHPNAVEPIRAKSADAGSDLTAISVEITSAFVEYGTGIAVEIPVGYVGLLFPRSSVTKRPMMLKNSVGVIDAGYRGEVKLRFLRTTQAGDIYDVGERVGQLVVVPVALVEWEQTEELSDSDRAQGGFGHTGN